MFLSSWIALGKFPHEAARDREVLEERHDSNGPRSAGHDVTRSRTGFRTLAQAYHPWAHGLPPRRVARATQFDAAWGSASNSSLRRRASPGSCVPSDRRRRCLVQSARCTVKWHQKVPWLFQRWWSGFANWRRTENLAIGFIPVCVPEAARTRSEGGERIRRTGTPQSFAFASGEYFDSELHTELRASAGGDTPTKAPLPSHQGQEAGSGLHARSTPDAHTSKNCLHPRTHPAEVQHQVCHNHRGFPEAGGEETPAFSRTGVGRRESAHDSSGYSDSRSAIPLRYKWPAGGCLPYTIAQSMQHRRNSQMRTAPGSNPVWSPQAIPGSGSRKAGRPARVAGPARRESWAILVSIRRDG
jgi:hypothetical protein